MLSSEARGVNRIRSSMPLAFLTGGTGFVGGHVARALVREGWSLRLLARDPSRAGVNLLDLGAEMVRGDLSDAGALESAVEGADAIIHVAGLVKERSLEGYREVNVRGTERLLAAAAKTAPDALFLLVSSQAAAGPAREGRPVSDADPSRPISWYGVSKHESEQAVQRSWKGPWIVLRPGVVYGPGDRGSGLFLYFRMAAAGWIPVPAGRTRIQIIAAEQAALAIARAASRRDLSGRIGFLCDPDPISLRGLAEKIAALPRRRGRLIGVPDSFVRALGAAETALEGLTRRSRPFNADKAKEILAGDWLCDAGPMRTALELPAPVPLEQGLKASWEWYSQAGWLPGATL
jgi:nucleoside-diphosphate-sugar epimerase